MSFWEDLQAWTQAQYDALMLANLKRKKKWTAEEINQLLRDRISKRLKAKQGRAIGAEFLRTPGRKPGEPEPGPAAVLDTGWYTRESGVSWIAVWSALASYYGATGFSNACNSITSPSLDGDNRHQSAWEPDHLADPPTTNPSRYTGLMRLFMQALYGANRDYWAATEFPYPGDWDDPDEMGCVRSPGGQYWLIRVSRTYGILAGKLAVPDEYQCLAALANGGSLTGFSQQIADALVMGNLTQALDEFGDPIWITLMDDEAEEFTDVYANGFEPLAWKWCWRFQTRGQPNAALAGAVICTHKSTVVSAFYGTRDMQYRESVLTISFDTEGTPSASIAENASGYFQAMDALYGGTPLSIYKASKTQITTLATAGFIVEPIGGTSEIGIMASCYAPNNDLAQVAVVGRGSDDPGDPNFPISVVGWASTYCTTSKTVSGTNLAVKTSPYIAFNGLTVSSITENGGRVEEYREVFGTDIYTAGAPKRYDVSMTRYGKVTSASTTNKAIISVECPGVVWMIGDHGASVNITDIKNSGLTNDCFYGFNFLDNPDCDIYGNVVNNSSFVDEIASSLMTIVGADSWLQDSASDEYAAVNAVLGAASPSYLGTSAGTTYGLDGFVSYWNLPNVVGTALPAGLNVDAAALPGLWVGGA